MARLFPFIHDQFAGMLCCLNVKVVLGIVYARSDALGIRKEHEQPHVIPILKSSI